MDERVAFRVRAFRKLKGYTQQELADRLNVSLGVLGALERGTRKPDLLLLRRISAVLGINYDELIGRNNGQNVHNR